MSVTGVEVGVFTTGVGVGVSAAGVGVPVAGIGVSVGVGVEVGVGVGVRLQPATAKANSTRQITCAMRLTVMAHLLLRAELQALRPGRCRKQLPGR